MVTNSAILGDLVDVPCAAGSARTIRYAEAALRRLRERSVEQFLSIPRGGIEVGGLLLGRFADGGVEILDWEELSIDHLNGPGFQLSEQDETGLTARLEQVGSMDVVGWWHSHTRSGVEITPADLAIHSRFFSDPQQIALIVKPFQFEPAQVAMYGSAGETLCAFTVGEPLFQKAPPPPPEKPRAARVFADPPVVAPRRPSRSWIWASTGGLLAAALAALFLLRPAPPPPAPVPPADPIRLSISEAGEQMTVRWDRDIRTPARDAEVIIIDGAQVTRIPLAADTPVTGTLAYVRRGTHIEVRMRGRLQNDELFEAVAHYVGPERIVAAPPAPAKPIQETTPESTRARTQPQEPLRRVVVLPRAVRHEQGAQVQYVAPPPVAAAPASEPVRIPVQTLSPPPPPPPRAPQQPASGRAIWTGVLPRGGVLLIDAMRPSAGSLTGKMPQRASRVRVYPADLIESGVVVYTAGARERTEPPSAANGWNVTTYRPDPRRTRDVTVVETPSQGNGWQRLMVRSDQRTISMLLIEWESID